MSEVFYVRIRGRIHGPIDRVKLATLVTRGQLSRIHEISSDGQTWRPAATMPELFVAARSKVSSCSPDSGPVTPLNSQIAAEGYTANQDPGFEPADAPWQDNTTSPTDDSISWYYAVNGAQQGPIATSELAELIRTHRVSDRDMVWKNDMDNWSEAGTVPTLVPFFHASLGQTSPSLASSPITARNGGFENVVNDELQQWSSTVGWVRNLAFLLGTVLIAVGVLCIIALSMIFSVLQLVLGIAQVVVGALLIWLVTRLVTLKRELQTADDSRTGNSIAEAVRTATPVWTSLSWNLAAILVAVVLILGTAFASYQPV